MLARVALVAFALTLGCSSSPRAPAQEAPLAGWTRVRSAPGGFSVELPKAPREKRANEGPVRAHLYMSEDEDGTVYEVAYFDLPEPLEPIDRRALMETVVVGLTGGKRTRLLSARKASSSGVPSLELKVAVSADRDGTWRIFYVGDRMFQVSAVGPAEPTRSPVRAAFFDSFRLHGEPYRAPARVEDPPASE
jgi:hypothetical protein